VGGQRAVRPSYLDVNAARHDILTFVLALVVLQGQRLTLVDVKQLAEVAIRLPAGESSKAFFAHIQELKKVLKLSLGIHVRAEALASAAN